MVGPPYNVPRTDRPPKPKSSIYQPGEPTDLNRAATHPRPFRSIYSKMERLLRKY